MTFSQEKVCVNYHSLLVSNSNRQ